MFYLLEFRAAYFGVLAALINSPIVWGVFVSAILSIGIAPIGSVEVVLWNLATIWATRFTVYGYGRLYTMPVIFVYMTIGCGHVLWLSLTTAIDLGTLVRVIFELFAPGFAAMVVVVAIGSLNRFVLMVGWTTYFTLYVII